MGKHRVHEHNIIMHASLLYMVVPICADAKMHCTKMEYNTCMCVHGGILANENAPFMQDGTIDRRF